MNCKNHPEAPAIAYCRECGKPLCEVCRRPADGTIYCEEHSPVSASAASGASKAAVPDSPYTAPEPSPYTAAPEPSPYTAPEPPPAAPETPYTAPPPPYTAPQPSQTRPRSSNDASPGLAFLLGFIPGVGAVYNGQYVKGLIHVVILGFLIAIVNDENLSANLQPLFGMMIAVWIFYMAFEAYHTAKKRQLGELVDEFSSIVPRHGPRARFPLAPTVLIVVGLIFLLHNLDILRISQMLRYWPIALIGFGVYMLYERVSASHDPRDSNRTGSQPPPGEQPPTGVRQ
ncbi:MAG TPA: DUF5668 domain-containing protein [Bryobacteraceae bacterium]|nr:DUF5668 domain-containing protein [Bryobacteraceae bacterium]